MLSRQSNMSAVEKELKHLLHILEELRASVLALGVLSIAAGIVALIVLSKRYQKMQRYQSLLLGLLGLLLAVGGAILIGVASKQVKHLSVAEIRLQLGAVYAMLALSAIVLLVHLGLLGREFKQVLLVHLGRLGREFKQVQRSYGNYVPEIAQLPLAAVALALSIRVAVAHPSI